MMILKDRAPLFTSICAGILWIYNEGLHPEIFYVSEGTAEIRRNICSVLAWGMKATEVDWSFIHEEKEKLVKKLAKSHIDVQIAQIQKTISFYEMMETKKNELLTFK